MPGGNDAGHEGAVAQPVLQRLLVGPVGPLLDPLEVGVLFAQTRVEHGHLGEYKIVLLSWIFRQGSGF